MNKKGRVCSQLQNGARSITAKICRDFRLTRDRYERYASAGVDENRNVVEEAARFRKTDREMFRRTSRRLLRLFRTEFRFELDHIATGVVNVARQFFRWVLVAGAIAIDRVVLSAVHLGVGVEIP